MAKVNWGILGAAKFAREHMAPAIQAARGARLYAVASNGRQPPEDFAPYQPDLKTFQSYDDLLADPDVDAVYVPLPNHLHVEWTLKALDAGKHVLTEKPIALKADEIDALIAKRDETGLLAAEAYMIVHHPQWQRAKHLLEDGAIGTLIHVDGHFSYDNSEDTGNIRNRPETGGGGIPDIGVYTYGATRWMTGKEPSEITHANVTFENGVDVIARVAAQFDGFTAHWINSMRMMAYQEMRFIGDTGVLRLTAPFNPLVYGEAKILLHQQGGSVRTESFPGVNHYVEQVQNFGAAIANPQSYGWTLEDARGTQAMIDQVFAAARG